MSLKLTAKGRRLTIWLGLFVLISWLGEFVHNRYELPQLTILSPENSIPLAISVVLFVLWIVLPAKRVMLILILAWALIHLIGGAMLSVLPLPILPFVPEQSVGHYVSHVIYGLAQIPLIALSIRDLRQPRKAVHHETPAV
jgi:hypothetical protein